MRLNGALGVKPLRPYSMLVILQHGVTGYYAVGYSVYWGHRRKTTPDVIFAVVGQENYQVEIDYFRCDMNQLAPRYATLATPCWSKDHNAPAQFCSAEILVDSSEL